MSKISLSGTVAVVTGGGRGLGRAMTLALAAEGCSVIATASRESDEIEAAAEQAHTLTGRDSVLAVTADVTHAEDCQRVIELALNRFGRLDVLVNNAGRGMKYVSPRFMTEPSRFWETPVETWRMVIDTNVNGPFLMARAAVPPMIASGWGRIINISMNRETMRRKGFSPYGPSKAALESETRIWSEDLAGTGVTVNALLPGGATDTGMIPAGITEEARQRLLPPEIIVPPLLWLVSRASDGVTGKRFAGTDWASDPVPQEYESL